MHTTTPRTWLLMLTLGGLCACTPRATLAPGCRPWDHALDSTEPPTHCLFFPSGLTMDPLGDLLYVTNSNADLSFGGGTLAAVDLLRYERAVSCFRRYGNQGGLTGDGACGQADCRASGKTLGDSASIEAVVRLEQGAVDEARRRGQGLGAADFDRCYCDKDLLDPTVINCPSDRFVLADQTVKTGNFSGLVKLMNEDPADWAPPPPRQLPAQLSRRVYLPVRGDPSITYVDVRRPVALSRTGATAAPVTMRCGAERKPGDLITYCEDNYRMQNTADSVLIDPNDPGQGERPRLSVPPEPYGLVLDRGCKLGGYTHRRGDTDVAGAPACRAANGALDLEGYYEYMVATHLSGDELSVYDLRGDPALPGRPILTDVRGNLVPISNAAMQRGVFSVAPRVPGDLSQPWYITSRLTGQIPTFRLLSTGPTVVPGLFFNIANSFANTGQDVRDMVFEPGAQRAFLSVQTPPAVAVVDTRLDPLSAPLGAPFNQVVNIIDVCPGPSRLVPSRTPRRLAGQPQPGGLTTRVYVACYQAGQLAVVDPDAGRLVERIQVGRGPLSIVLNHGGEQDGGQIDPCADPFVGDKEAKLRGVTCPPADGLRARPLGDTDLPPRAYVTTYIDNAIAVVDLDPRSLTYQRLVSRIGFPSPKVQ